MDIVERLRKRAEDDKFIAMHTRVVAGDSPWMTNSKLLKEAADEIERLREALKPFAKIADDYETLHDEDYVSVHRHDIELRHFRAIRSALQQKDSE